MDTNAMEQITALWPTPDPLQGFTPHDIGRELGLLGAANASPASVASVAPGGWPTLANAALYGLAGDIVNTISPHSEADPAALLMQFMAAFGNVIGPGAHCVVESLQHGLNLFVVLVGESSKARKGTSWGHIRRLFERVDPDWMANRVASGLSSAEGLINEVRDDPPTDRRLLAMADEFASVLRTMAREGNTLSPILRSAWDSGNLRTLVKNDPLKATGAHISLVGHITRQELLKYLNDTESHNGFANRLLWTCVKRSKYLPEGGAVPRGELDELAARLAEVVTWAREGERTFQRDSRARSLWAAVYNQLSDGLPGLLGAATSRAEAQVLRLSALYAALDQSLEIRVPHLQAALSIWDYCFASAKYVFGDATGDAVMDRMRKALEAAGAAGMSRTEIRDLFKRHEKVERVERALDQLATLGLARRHMHATEGRSNEVWFATKAT